MSNIISISFLRELKIGSSSHGEKWGRNSTPRLIYAPSRVFRSRRRRWSEGSEIKKLFSQLWSHSTPFMLIALSRNRLYHSPFADLIKMQEEKLKFSLKKVYSSAIRSSNSSFYGLLYVFSLHCTRCNFIALLYIHFYYRFGLMQMKGIPVGSLLRREVWSQPTPGIGSQVNGSTGEASSSEATLSLTNASSLLI